MAKPLVALSLGLVGCLGCVPSQPRTTGTDALPEAAAAVARTVTLPAPPRSLPSPPRADAEAPAGPSPLHVFVTVLDDPAADKDGLPPASRRRAHVCSPAGLTALCGLPGLYVFKDGAFVRDRSLEAGLPKAARFDTYKQSYADGVFGRWPDDAWLSFSRDAGIDLPDLTGVTHAVYRWRGKAWERVRSDIKGDFQFLPWGAGGAVAVSLESWYADHWIEGLGARRGTRAIPPYVPDGGLSGRLGSPLTFADGSFAAVYEGQGPTWGVLRWAGGTTLAESDPMRADDGSDAQIAIGGIWGPSRDDLVAFGWQRTPKDDTRPYLTRYDGTRWSPLAAPPGQEEVRSYAHDDAGNAWAIAADGSSPTRMSLWRGATDGDWSRVALPLECQPWEVTRTADGAMWVACLGWDKHPKVERFILSTLVPSRAIEVDPFGAAP